MKGPMFVFSTAVLSAATLVLAQTPKEDLQESGAYVFQTYCGACHGAEGKGDGPVAEHLRIRPPDLTRLAQRNQGRFDGEQVHRIIDGRNQVKGHGGPDMPVWGDAFKNSQASLTDAQVSARIKSLVEHLQGLQEKSAK